MKNKKTIIGVLTGSIATFALLATVTSVGAYRGDPDVQGPNYDEETHAVLEQALDEGDYNTWVEAFPGNGRRGEVVTEDNFDKIAEMHKAQLAGDTEKVDQLRAELGFGQGGMGEKGGGNRDGEGFGNRSGGMGEKGMNEGGRFVDANRDGSCDNL